MVNDHQTIIWQMFFVHVPSILIKQIQGFEKRKAAEKVAERELGAFRD